MGFFVILTFWEHLKDVISFYKYHKTGIIITPTIDVSSRKQPQITSQ